jgi:hypothetical protein
MQSTIWYILINLSSTKANNSVAISVISSKKLEVPTTPPPNILLQAPSFTV